MNGTQGDAQGSQPRAFYFTLKSLLGFFVVCAVLMAWWQDHRTMSSRARTLQERLDTALNEVKRNAREAALLQQALREESLLGQEGVPQPSGKARVDYSQCSHLAEAITLLEAKLRSDGMKRYASLISEATIRKSILTAIDSYEGQLDEIEARFPGAQDLWQEVKPVYLDVANKGTWSHACSFDCFYGWTDANHVTSDGLGLRLSLRDGPGGFALPIVDLSYGRFQR